MVSREMESFLTEHERAAVADLESKIGMRLDSADPYDGGMMPFYSQVTKDAIRHCAWSIGDLNPLWFSEEYATASVVGRLTAIPALLFSLAPGGMSGYQFADLRHLFGQHETWGGAAIQWMRRLDVGTVVATETRLKDIQVKNGTTAGVLVQLTAETLYLNVGGDLLARSDSWVFRRRLKKYSGAFEGVSLKRWSQAELAELAAEKAAHRVRGSELRRWRDIAIGDTFGLTKGPYSMSANFCFSSLWHPTHSYFGDLTPGDLTTDTAEAAQLPLGFRDVSNPHRDAQEANSNGLPGPYDYGPQRFSWASQLITDWMGDAGFLESLNFQVRSYCFLGDIQRFTATVTAKRTRGNDHLVDCDIQARNQSGHMTGGGYAVVRLEP
jgi:acyl dehydratase